MTLPADAVALLRAAARAAGPKGVCLVGGAVRDAVLGRPLTDLDIACHGAKTLALKLGKTLGASFVVLDDGAGVYRLVLRRPQGAVAQVDVAEISGRDIADDLARRDFTLNALALPLAPAMNALLKPGALIDPRRGLADIRRRVLRCESAQPLKEDPVRLLRAFRIAAQLDFRIDAETLASIKACRKLARAPAGERLQSELVSLLAIPGCSVWLERMDKAGILTSVFRELEPQRRCATQYYGKGGVLRHSLDTAARADFLMSSLERALPATAPALREHIARQPAVPVPYRAAIVLAALVHDIAKPKTARMTGGRLRFFGHDTLGAKAASKMLRGLRFPGETTDLVATIVAHHLRPGNLAAGGKVTDRAAYRFFRDLGDDAVSLLLACWADHASYLSSRALLKHLGDASADPHRFDASRLKPAEVRKTVFHLQVVSHLLGRYFDRSREPVPERLLDGNEVMKALGLPPGPSVGRVLEGLREAQAVGKIKTRQEALKLLPKLKTRLAK